MSPSKIRTGLLALLAAGGACSKKAAPAGTPAVEPTASDAAEPAPPPDAAPAADAAPAGPRHAHGFHFSVTVPDGWKIGPSDPVLPGNVTLTGPDRETA